LLRTEKRVNLTRTQGGFPNRNKTLAFAGTSFAAPIIGHHAFSPNRLEGIFLPSPPFFPRLARRKSCCSRYKRNFRSIRSLRTSDTKMGGWGRTDPTFCGFCIPRSK
jgi:hypothetical protein